MTTGAFWNVDNPDKPWGLFDPDAQLPFPFDWSEWLTNEGATYASHIITPQAGLEEVSSTQAAGVITVLIKATDPDALTVNRKYAVTCSITATAGALTLKDDRTVYLKIKQR
jgi:hypothetical protein